jgi:hypothetical protein
VRGPSHVAKTGKTPVLDGKEWRTSPDGIPTKGAPAPHFPAEAARAKE